MRKLFQTKRAADANQMFIYVASVVVVGFVFIYGFKAVYAFLRSSQQIERAQFITDFTHVANTVSNAYGSVKYLPIVIPSQFRKLCVVELSAEPLNVCGPLDTPTPLGDLTDSMCASWWESYTYNKAQSDYEASVIAGTPIPKPDVEVSQKNVFFTDLSGAVVYSDLIERIKLDPGADTLNPTTFFCVDSTRKNSQLRLEGLGREASVSLE